MRRLLLLVPLLRLGRTRSLHTPAEKEIQKREREREAQWRRGRLEGGGNGTAVGTLERQTHSRCLSSRDAGALMGENAGPVGISVARSVGDE